MPDKAGARAGRVEVHALERVHGGGKPQDDALGVGYHVGAVGAGALALDGDAVHEVRLAVNGELEGAADERARLGKRPYDRQRVGQGEVALQVVGVEPRLGAHQPVLEAQVPDKAGARAGLVEVHPLDRVDRGGEPEYQALLVGYQVRAVAARARAVVGDARDHVGDAVDAEAERAALDQAGLDRRALTGPVAHHLYGVRQVEAALEALRVEARLGAHQPVLEPEVPDKAGARAGRVEVHALERVHGGGKPQDDALGVRYHVGAVGAGALALDGDAVHEVRLAVNGELEGAADERARLGKRPYDRQRVGQGEVALQVVGVEPRLGAHQPVLEAQVPDKAGARAGLVEVHPLDRVDRGGEPEYQALLVGYQVRAVAARARAVVGDARDHVGDAVDAEAERAALDQAGLDRRALTGPVAHHLYGVRQVEAALEALRVEARLGAHQPVLEPEVPDKAGARAGRVEVHALERVHGGGKPQDDALGVGYHVGAVGAGALALDGDAVHEVRLAVNGELEGAADERARLGKRPYDRQRVGQGEVALQVVGVEPRLGAHQPVLEAQVPDKAGARAGLVEVHPLDRVDRGGEPEYQALLVGYQVRAVAARARAVVGDARDHVGDAVDAEAERAALDQAGLDRRALTGPVAHHLYGVRQVEAALEALRVEARLGAHQPVLEPEVPDKAGARAGRVEVHALERVHGGGKPQDDALGVRYHVGAVGAGALALDGDAVHEVRLAVNGELEGAADERARLGKRPYDRQRVGQGEVALQVVGVEPRLGAHQPVLEAQVPDKAGARAGLVEVHPLDRVDRGGEPEYQALLVGYQVRAVAARARAVVGDARDHVGDAVDAEAERAALDQAGLDRRALTGPVAHHLYGVRQVEAALEALRVEARLGAHQPVLEPEVPDKAGARAGRVEVHALERVHGGGKPQDDALGVGYHVGAVAAGALALDGDAVHEVRLAVNGELEGAADERARLGKRPYDFNRIRKIKISCQIFKRIIARFESFKTIHIA